MTSDAAVDALVRRALERFGRIDAFVACAFVSVYAEVERTEPEELPRVMNVNFDGRARCFRAVLPALRASRGTFVDVNSALAYRGIPLQSAYCASKAASRAFFEAARVELEKEGAGVDLVLVLPGAINTPHFDRVRQKLGLQPQPVPPVYQPEVVADAVVRVCERPARELAGRLGRAEAALRSEARAARARLLPAAGGVVEPDDRRGEAGRRSRQPVRRRSGRPRRARPLSTRVRATRARGPRSACTGRRSRSREPSPRRCRSSSPPAAADACGVRQRDPARYHGRHKAPREKRSPEKEGRTNLALLQLRNLHVALEDGTEIVKGVDLAVDANEVHAIMGPNGSGKSTLAYALMGHPAYEITEGEILFDGEDVTEMEADERAQRGLFLAFQYPHAIPGVTVTSFLRSAVNAIRKARNRGEDDPVPVKEFRTELLGAMERLRVPRELAQRYLNDGFSGGEKKRVEILQMAVLKPRIAVLDETDSGLDIDALKIVAGGVKDLVGPEMGAVVITHYQRILDHIEPDFVHVFVDGRIVAQGGPELAHKLEAEGYEAFAPQPVGGGGA